MIEVRSDVQAVINESFGHYFAESKELYKKKLFSELMGDNQYGMALLNESYGADMEIINEVAGLYVDEVFKDGMEFNEGVIPVDMKPIEQMLFEVAMTKFEFEVEHGYYNDVIGNTKDSNEQNVGLSQPMQESSSDSIYDTIDSIMNW
jgi:hypothetical protein